MNNTEMKSILIVTEQSSKLEKERLNTEAKSMRSLTATEIAFVAGGPEMTVKPS